MPVRRDKKRRRWFFRFTAHTPTGKRSIYGCPGTPGPFQHLSNTKEGALEAERIARANLAKPDALKPPAPTLMEFCEGFYLEKMQTVGNRKGANKQSVLDTKRSHLRTHL
jgi:hypothetical protein